MLGHIAGAATGKCLDAHKDDIKKAVQPAVDGANRAIEKGWERDNKAGGISSWGTDGKTAHA